MKNNNLKKIPKDWQIVFVFMAVQAFFLFWLRAEFLTDWDSYLYAYGGVMCEPISLAGGRWLFTGLLHVVWRAVNDVRTISPDSAWAVFSYAMMGFAILNVRLFFSLARRWCEREGAIVATAIFVSSPLVGLYGSAVMTETVALTAMLGSLLILSQRTGSVWRIILAGVIFGAGCTIREPMVLLSVVPAGLIFFDERRGFWWPAKIVLFFAAMGVVIGGNLLLVWTQGESWEAIYASWSAGMARERMQMGHTAWKMVVRNVLCLAVWVAIFSPMVLLTIPGQVKALWEKWNGWAGAVAMGVLLYAAGEVANHSLVFNPRFVIFMGVLMCLPAGLAIWRRVPERIRNPYLLAGLIVGVNAMGISMFWSGFENYYFAKSQSAKETYQTLADAPDNAVFLPGRLTPVVELYRKIHNTGWTVVYAGWDFSDKELSKTVESARESGRRVYLVEERFWGERPYRSGQYIAMESVWRGYEHRVSEAAHFYRLVFPQKSRPGNVIRRAWDFLMS
jgi:hypothetical protein